MLLSHPPWSHFSHRPWGVWGAVRVEITQARATRDTHTRHTHKRTRLPAEVCVNAEWGRHRSGGMEGTQMIQLQSSAGPFHTARGSSCWTLFGERRFPGNKNWTATISRQIRRPRSLKWMRFPNDYKTADGLFTWTSRPTNPARFWIWKKRSVVFNNRDCYCLIKRAPSELVIANYILSLNLFLIVFVQQGNYQCISCFTNSSICFVVFFFYCHFLQLPDFKLFFFHRIKLTEDTPVFCFLFFLILLFGFQQK